MKTYAYVLFVLLAFGCKTAHEQVLFTSGRDGNSNVYVMNDNGEELKKLSNSKNDEWSPVWVTKDEISFLRQLKEEIKIIQLNLLTGEEREISHPKECLIDDKNIRYSPKQKNKLYGCKGNLFVEFQATKEVVNLTEKLEGKSRYGEWIDEENIIFTNNQDGANNIYSIHVKTLVVKTIVNSESNDERGTLSPDGKYVLYSSDQYEKGNQEIVLGNIKSGEQLNISNSKGTELLAKWSKDGQTIFYGSNKDDNWELYAYDLKTKQTKRLTNHKAFDGDPRIYR